ncbi:MAG: MoaD/ThiS family protein [Chloroflexi bacterium]|nr:MoaD/ThiS family protein [Chloroflexota bacterium]
MAVIRIPPVLRNTLGGLRTVEAEGATVAEVLGDLYRRYPALRGHLLSEEGKFHPFINVYLNDEDLRYLNWLETPVKPEDTLIILPAIAGGDWDPR